MPLQDVTKLGIFFGRISQVHFESLKSFPWIFFNDVTEFSLDYNIASKKEEGDSVVFYDLVLTKDNDNLDKRYKALEDAVRALFWKEVQVKILINHVEVYKSEN